MNIECCQCCVKKNKIIDKQQKIINKLQKDRDAWARKHWAMVGDISKLEDKLGALKHCNNEIIKGILLKE